MLRHGDESTWELLQRAAPGDPTSSLWALVHCQSCLHFLCDSASLLLTQPSSHLADPPPTGFFFSFLFMRGLGLPVEAPAGLGQPLHRLRKLTKGICQAQRVQHAQGAGANGSSGLSDAKARPSIVSIHPLLTTLPPPAPTAYSPTHLLTYHLPTLILTPIHLDSHLPTYQPPISPPLPLSSHLPPIYQSPLIHLPPCPSSHLPTNHPFTLPAPHPFTLSFPTYQPTYKPAHLPNSPPTPCPPSFPLPFPPSVHLSTTCPPINLSVPGGVLWTRCCSRC